MDAPKAIHAVAHTARILTVLEANPQHPRRDEYAKSLKIYRGQWAELSEDEKITVAVALIRDPEATDMDKETVGKAVAALEA